MRETGLKRTARGYVRNLGRDQAGRHQKFYLGHDKPEAERRLKAIVVLWQQIEARFGTAASPVWDADRLAAAKAIASGEGPTLQKGPHEPPRGYFARVNETSRQSGVGFRPANEFLYDVGRNDLAADVETSQSRLSTALGTPTATGQTLHQALRAYQGHIRHEFGDHDGTPTDNGRTKIDQIKTIMAYVPDADLGALDYHATDELFGVFRRRPISKRYGTPMARKSCTNYIGELGRFLKWLHLSKDFRWRLPEDFALIKRAPRELDEDAEREAREPDVWTVEQLKILNEYARPLERVFLLLGLNCAYGADQAGRLRVGHLRISESDQRRSYIRRIRRKKKTLSIHQLWRQTADGLRWAVRRREKQAADSELLLLTDSGRPFWRKTTGGHRSQLIPNLWSRLLDRIQKDHPQFPRYPFNSLRDTSANMVRQRGGEEIALLHLSHKHQSRDSNLRRYTHPTRKRHFRVLRWVERKLQEVFGAAGPEPWAARSKTYIGRSKIKEIQRLHDEHVGVTGIAKRVGVSTSTVYRHLVKPANAEPGTPASGGHPRGLPATT